MSIPLWKLNIKKNIFTLTMYYLVLLLYMVVILSMFNPEQMDEIQEMLSLFPEAMMKAMGFHPDMNDLNALLASWLYGLLMVAFPMVYSILLTHKLIGKMLENGSFAYLLSTPNSRTKILMNQGMFCLGSMLLLFVMIFLSGVITSEILFPGLLDLKGFFYLNLLTMLVNMLSMMISFLCSSAFCESKWALGLGAGIPIGFLLLQLLGGSSDKLENIQRLGIFGWFDPVEVIRGAPVTVTIISYLIGIVALFIVALLRFRKRPLFL